MKNDTKLAKLYFLFFILFKVDFDRFYLLNLDRFDLFETFIVFQHDICHL